MTFYRPRWTCGRYNAEKHVAIMYNLLSGRSFFLENASADLVGYILKAGRDGEVEMQSLAKYTNISIDSLLPFSTELLNNGLLTDHIYSNEELRLLRQNLALFKIQSSETRPPLNVDGAKTIVSNSEMCYYDAVASPHTITSAMMELTYTCSEKCIHCYNHGATRNDKEISYRANRNELTLLEYKRIIDDLYAHGLVKVCLTGGDPFSNPLAWEIIDYLYHKDIAFEFASWLSPEFKLYLITEFQRLKKNEAYYSKKDWHVNRVLAKVSYTIHTDTIKNVIIPTLTEKQKKFVYAEEADVINVALFGMTAKEWKEANSNLADNGNIRDYTDLLHLVILSNLENINAELIEVGLSQSERLIRLNDMAKKQMEILRNNKSFKNLEFIEYKTNKDLLNKDNNN